MLLMHYISDQINMDASEISGVIYLCLSVCVFVLSIMFACLCC